MYLKLALRNIKRSAKDYVIYFVTIILIVMLMYSFLALGFSDDIISMSENMSMLTTGMIVFSVIVSLISSYIVGYAVQFMLRQRKKEFAIYELLGMEVGTIQKLFFIENSVIGVLAFGIGIILGTGIVGILAGVVKSIFQVPHTYQILFSSEAFVLCVIFFVCMYGAGIVRAVRIIKREKIVDLLYDSRKNEMFSKEISTRVQFVHVIFGVLAIVVGIFLIGEGMSQQSNATWIYLVASVILLLVGLYDIYRIFPIMMIKFVKKNAKMKYTECNLFFLGQMGHRIQSSGRMMAITAILFTLSLSTMFVGLLLGAGYKANMKVYYPYDVGVAIDAPFTKDSLKSLISFVDSKCPVQDDNIYYLYDVDEYSIDALALSDYNKLRSMLGFEKVEMSDDEYLVHCDTWNYTREIEMAMKSQHEITVTGVELYNPQSKIYQEAMEQFQMAGTNGYVLVLPDHITSNLPANKIRLVLKLENEGIAELRSEIRRYLNSGEWVAEIQEGEELPEQVTIGVTVQAWGVSNSLTGFTSISFCSLYMSIAFILLSCTILAFEQLSTLDKNRRSYQTIDRIGVSRTMQRKLIHLELATFFFIPFVLPAIVIFILMLSAQSLYSSYIMQENIILLYGFVTIAIFVVIYYLYYVTTCFLYRRNIIR